MGTPLAGASTFFASLPRRLPELHLERRDSRDWRLDSPSGKDHICFGHIRLGGSIFFSDLRTAAESSSDTKDQVEFFRHSFRTLFVADSQIARFDANVWHWKWWREQQQQNDMADVTASILFLNKKDLSKAVEVEKQVRHFDKLKDRPVEIHVGSAVTGEGVHECVSRLLDISQNG